MGRIRITELRPLLKYRRPERAGTKVIAYTLEDAMREDRNRAKRIIRAIPRRDGVFKKKQAKCLSARLDVEQGQVPKTLASAAHIVELREPILDHLVRLAGKAKLGRVMTGALLPQRNAHLRAGDLQKLDPRKFMLRLRSDLIRCGAAEADGYIFAVLHAEFGLPANRLHPHYHFIAVGGMIEVLERLRSRGKYAVANIAEEAGGGHAAALRTRELEPSEARYALSYLFQQYWPARWSGISEDNKKVRGPRARVPEPYHTEWLLWMDRQRLENFVLMMHLQVGRRGLRIINRKKPYFNLEGQRP
jgi:hypothetical protein